MSVEKDLISPVSISRRSRRIHCFLHITDEYTRYRKVYFLKKKSDALESFKLYVNAAWNETGKIPLAIQTDGGG